MTDKEIWSRHVASWRASGQTAAAFSADHGLSVATLRRWSSKFKREAAAATALTVPQIRLAQVVRPATPAATCCGAVIVDLLDLRARVTVEAGAERATLQVVLAALGVGGAR